MSALSAQRGASTRETVGARLSDRTALFGAIVLSRVLVLLAGAAGSLAAPRREPWEIFDRAGLSLNHGLLGGALTGGAVRWDAIHYLTIARHGYTALNSVFYPLYPLLVRGLGQLVGSDASAGMVISAAAFAGALVLLVDLTRRELGSAAARTTGVLLAFTPLSFFFSAVYTESLYLLLSVATIWAARTGRWRAAAPLAGLAALTRVNGVLLVVPLAFMWWDQRPRRRRRLLCVCAPLVGLGAYLAATALQGFGWLAPFHEESFYGRVFRGPLGAVIAAVKAAGSGVKLLTAGPETFVSPGIGGALSFGAESVVLLAVLALSIVVARLAVRRLPRPLWAYALIGLLITLSSPDTGQPLTSFDRYVLTIFPLWMAAGAWLSERPRLRVATTVLSAALLGFYSFEFATWSFIA